MPSQKSPVVFILDDNPSNVKVLSETLKSFGYKTLVAMDGLSGIQKITKAQPDIILLDILMPVLDGFETCQRLKQSEVTRDIPVIFMTALASTADKVKGLKLGAVDYVTKPFQEEELIARLELHLQLRRLSKDLAIQNQQLQAEIAQRETAEAQIKILSKVSEQSPASIVITDMNGNITYVNPKFQELTGYRLEDVIGKNPRILKSGETSSEEYAHIWKLLSNGLEWHGEFHNKKRNGELYWEQASISSIKDDNGEITHYVAVKEDITLRKQAELDLFQQLERERMVSKLTLSIRQSLDLSEILNSAVLELKRILGVDRVLIYVLKPDGSGKVLAESTTDRMDSILGIECSQEVFPESIYQSYINGRVYQVEDIEALPIVDESSTCMVQFCRKLKIKAKLVIAIVQNDNLWGLLVAQHSEPFHWQTWATALLFQVSNQLAIAISQANLYQQVQIELAEKIQAERALLVLNQELEDRVAQRTAELEQSKLQVQIELEERKQIELQLQKNNEQLAITNIELARATRLKDEFLANMSHELRTPLNAILGMSETLQEGILGDLSDRQKKAITMIENGGQHLLALITDILDLAKIESGKLELHIDNIEIKKLCNDSLIFVKQLAFKKNIQLILNISDQLKQPQFAYIQVDELRIRQALINLLSNAVKFTNDGGTVTLEAQISEISHEDTQPKFYIDFLVTDTGIGIAQEDVGKIFQTFVQIDSALNRKYAGTGLGLSLVKKIVEMHGGSVDFESELGKSSKFRIRLPYQPDLTTNDNLDNLSPAKSNKDIDIAARDTPYTILIAEDDAANVETMRSYLENRGYKLLLASNGKIAVDMAITQKVDIILMDIQMPEMDGLTATRLIRANPKTANIPIIALTALAMKGDQEKCIDAGADGYITKPVRLRKLVDSIQALLQLDNSDHSPIQN